MKKSTIKSNWPKHLLQWGTLAVLVFFVSGLASKLFTSIEKADPEKFCPFGGLEALATYFQRGSLPCSMSTMQIMMGIALAAGVVLFGKLFCSYICPIGTVEDLLMRLRKAIRLKPVPIKGNGIVDKILRVMKYALLFYVVYMTVSASELFCKNLDPWYAVATGFKGEITLWMSIVTVCVVLLLGLVVDRFWCKYLCPLGAICTSLKFWVWLVLLVGIWWCLGLIGLNIAWFWLLGAYCLLSYLLEILCGKSKTSPVAIILDESRCGRRCKSCQSACPYGIEVWASGGRVNCVDCMLCGECIAACPSKALSVGTCKNKPAGRWTRFIPAVLAVLLVVGGYVAGNQFELPTIDESWGVEEGMTLETVKVENLKTVKCYGSSMAFKARMEKVKGVHGVKTFVGSHSVVVSFDPAATTADKVREEIFEPSHFRINSPDPAQYSEVKCVTIRTEHMADKLDLNRLGMQFRLTGRKIFGLESEYDCPLVVRVYMAPEEEADEAWFREIVNKKTLEMPVHGGGVKTTELDFEFVKMEKGFTTMPIDEYLERMFDPFKAEFNGQYEQADTTVIRKRTEVYEGEPQYIYEIAHQGFEKPIYKRYLPYLSNHLSREEGVIGFYLRLNKALVPSMQVRFAAPMTEERVWELLSCDTWTITYSKDDVREQAASIKFDEPGICYRYEE